MPALSVIRDRKLRLALVGCGRIAQTHFAALKQHADRVELVGVCDNQPQALQAAVASTGATGFASLDDLLAGCDADLVALATPSGLLPDELGEIDHEVHRRPDDGPGRY